MKFKLDENFGARTQQLFCEAFHEILTVPEQKLKGCTDQELYKVCCDEQCCLVTLDLDFSDVTRFSPDKTNGIVVIRVPRNPSLRLLDKLIRQFLKALQKMQVEKKLWIVEIDRIRVHELKDYE